jgi:hypothetical protein
MVLDKEKILDILVKKLEHLSCRDCSNLNRRNPYCHECNVRWVISEEYAREIADLIVKKGVSEQ